MIGQIALIALGSNQHSVWGDAGETIMAAVAALRDLAQDGLQCSAFYATPAFPAGAGPDFVNAAVAFETVLPAADLLAALHGIEAAAGRERLHRWGQRTLDLDLIALGQDVAPDLATHAQWRNLPPAEQVSRAPDELILPHPRMQDRAFVLVPLADVAPDWRHPILGETVAAMLARQPKADVAAVRSLGEMPKIG
jgi:2-amino-4-hydroxy-6-hydroxymethyldihydropteridine diphosphokinase